jgi:hypothetical protein
MRLGPFYSSRKLPWIRDRRQRHAIGNACCRCSLGTRDCMVIRSSLGNHRCSRSLDLTEKSMSFRDVKATTKVKGGGCVV